MVDAIGHASNEVPRTAGIVAHLQDFVRGREPRRSCVDIRPCSCSRRSSCLSRWPATKASP